MASNNKVTNEAFVTLATTVDYALAACVLATSLKNVKTTRQIDIMITPGLPQAIQAYLRQVFDHVHEVTELNSNDKVHLGLLGRQNLGVTFTKINCWGLTMYEKCVFMDADTLVLQGCDELFDREEFSAAPDAGWPDCFNSGVFVFKPNIATLESLKEFAAKEGSFDGGDQGLLNAFFPDWSTTDIHKHLPFIYNMVSSAYYSYLPAYHKYGSRVKVVHFIGENKPWLLPFGSVENPIDETLSTSAKTHVRFWLKTYTENVLPTLPQDVKALPEFKHFLPNLPSQGANGKGDFMSGSASSYSEGNFSELNLGSRPNLREDWEAGQPDYLGAASFSNILARISQSMSNTPASSSCHSSCSDLRNPSSSLPDLSETLKDCLTMNNTIETTRLSKSLEDIPNYLPFEAPDPVEENRISWLQGNPDYMGMNAFDNIKAKLDTLVVPPITSNYVPNQVNDIKDINDNVKEDPIIDATEANVEVPADNREDWERGHPDYMGAASFNNILKRIELSSGIPSNPSRGPPEPENLSKSTDCITSTNLESKAISRFRSEPSYDNMNLERTHIKRGSNQRIVMLRPITLICSHCGQKQEVSEENLMSSLSNVNI